MSSPLVGSARVEIVGDVGKFATSTESEIKRGLGQAGHAVDDAGKSMENNLGAHGKAAGVSMTKGMANEVHNGRGALEQAGKTAGSAAGSGAGTGYTSSAGQAMNRGLSGLKSKIKGQFGDMAKLAVGAFAVDKVGEFFSSAIDEARESQKVNAQTAAVIKGTGSAAKLSAAQVGDLAGQISAYAGIDDEAIQSGENMLLTFTNIHNEAGKGNDIFNQATKIMTDMSVSMGTDMKGQAIQLGKALNDPIKGIGALSKVGVTFTDQQKTQIKAMMDAGNAAGAQQVILKELGKEFGGSAAAQATAADKASVSWGNFKESVGTAVLPVLDKFWQFMNGHVIPVLQAVLGWITRNGETIKTLALVLAPLVVAWATYAAVTKTVAIAQGILNAVMAANPIVLVVMAIAGLVAMFVIAWKHSETFRNIIKGAFHVVAAAGEAVWHFLQAAWERVGKPLFDLIVRLIRGYIKIYTTIFWGIVDAFKAVWDGVRTAWDWVWDHVFLPIKRGVSKIAGWIGDAVGAVNKVWHKIGDGLQWVYDHTIGPIINFIKGAIQDIKDALDEITGAASDIGTGGHAHVGGSVSGGPSFHARGGELGLGVNIVGEEGIEAIFNTGSRQYVMDNASTKHKYPHAGGSGGGLSDADRDLLVALASRPIHTTVTLPDKRVLARATSEGDMLRDRAR